ncbi:ScyD/ScyE family protein [Modestobacter sp. I12A-02662]|uniref:ScyD/ScyE family protein n=1 Tax=Modestobacter sp. I12A-02662 TaxID=1730496 RepID=UPI0034DE23E9
MKRLTKTAVALTGAAALAVVPATAAAAQVTTVATGLDGPRQLSAYEDGLFVVAESDVGEVSSVDPGTGEVQTLVSGLFNPQGVAYADGDLYIAVGSAPPPGEPGPPLPEGAATESLLVVDPGDGTVLQTIDLLAHELAENPDGQVQFVDGAPVDALSNPFAVLAQGDRVLVADAGANAVLSVDPDSGEVSTFFVPPVVGPADVPVCGERMNNPGTVGCDPVPTGLAEGPDGEIYVSTLGSEAPGAARIYELDEDGAVQDVHHGLTSLVGVAVDGDGVVYASYLLEGAPEGEPAPGFDPATVGAVVRVAGNGERTWSQVTMPTGLAVDGGELYASAWSTAAFVGGPAGSGQVAQVGSDTFAAAAG